MGDDNLRQRTHCRILLGHEIHGVVVSLVVAQYGP
jgi:hypothetical protein